MEQVLGRCTAAPRIWRVVEALGMCTNSTNSKFTDGLSRGAIANIVAGRGRVEKYHLPKVS